WRRQRGDRDARARRAARRLGRDGAREHRRLRRLRSDPDRGDGLSTRVLIVDDQALVRSGFRMVVDARPDLEVVGEAENGEEAVRLAAELDPDVILLDIRMPVLDGIEATKQVVASGSRARILVLTTFDLDEYVYAAI